jgi:mRNA interferase MazF
MKQGGIWWVERDFPIGTEILKKRPAVIVSNTTANKILTRVVVVPLTSNIRELYPGEVIVKVNQRYSKAVVSQILAVDKQRLEDKLGDLLPKDWEMMQHTIRAYLGL